MSISQGMTLKFIYKKLARPLIYYTGSNEHIHAPKNSNGRTMPLMPSCINQFQNYR